MNDKSLYIANVVGALGDLVTYMLCATDLDAGAEADRNYVNQDPVEVEKKFCDAADVQPGLGCGEPIGYAGGALSNMDKLFQRMECLRIMGGNLDKAAAAWDFVTNAGPRQNLGLASNYDLARELDKRHAAGHTEPTYRSIDEPVRGVKERSAV